MRTAIFFGALIIAKSIPNHTDYITDRATDFTFLGAMFVIIDIIYFYLKIIKLTK